MDHMINHDNKVPITRMGTPHCLLNLANVHILLAPRYIMLRIQAEKWGNYRGSILMLIYGPDLLEQLTEPVVFDFIARRNVKVVPMTYRSKRLHSHETATNCKLKVVLF